MDIELRSEFKKSLRVLGALPAPNVLSERSESKDPSGVVRFFFKDGSSQSFSLS